MSSNFLKFLYWFTFIVLICALFVIWWLTHRNNADVTADFGDHTSTYSIPANFFGAQGMGSTIASQSGIDNITNVHLYGNRLWLPIDTIFASGNISSPNYSAYDAQLQRATQNGLDPLITVYGVPASLAASNCTPPRDVNTWAAMAAAAIKHTDQLHPGLWYELWNEPDFTLCNTSNALSDYLRMYGALGPLFRKAAPTAKFGGPSLASSGNTSTWMPALLSGATAPYVDFASFHIYITGTWMLPGMTWDQAYQQTQSETNGLAYYYRLFEKTVRAGQQPNAATTPIDISEYNTNYDFSPNNVQNDPVYGPLWNSVAVSDFLNVVAQGSFPPWRIHYFAAGDSRSYFCLEGIAGGDPKMCNPPTAGQPYNAQYVPYPVLKDYELFCSTTYLNLEPGFSVVAPPAAPNGLLTLALYTPTADTLVLINPTATTQVGLKVKLSHLGFKPARGQQFVLSNNAFTTSDLRIAPANNITTKTDVPAYSTVAIHLTSQ